MGRRRGEFLATETISVVIRERKREKERGREGERGKRGRVIGRDGERCVQMREKEREERKAPEGERERLRERGREGNRGREKFSFQF